MSMMNAAMPTPEVGETVATYKKYEGAQKAVSKLIAENIPARDIAIVGGSLRSIEKITGKLGWARSAWQGALNGVLLGLLFAAFAVIWMPEPDMPMVGGILLIGVGFGMAFRLLNYSIVRRKRDYASFTAISAEHYEVTVARQHVPEARRLLGTVKTRTQVVRPPSVEPPRYGIRIDDQATTTAAPSAPSPAPEQPEAAAPAPAAEHQETPVRDDAAPSSDPAPGEAPDRDERRD